MLYPQNNAFRAALDLGGFWRFRPDPEGVGRADGWASASLPDSGTHLIAVPGSWNEQLAEVGLMNYVGQGWYETDVSAPSHLVRDHRLWLYVAAADHRAEVWLNGRSVGTHEGGYVPFEVDLTDAWRTDAPNRLTICVDSALTMTTLPQNVDPAEPPYDSPAYERRHLFPPTRFDFFPYGGLTRSVWLCAIPRQRIERIRIDSSLDGVVRMRVEGGDAGSRLEVEVLDRDDRSVAIASAPVEEGTTSVEMRLKSVRRWSPSDPYLYTVRVRLVSSKGTPIDGYDEQFGIREIRTEGGQLLLNGEPLYLVGYGKHEDYPVMGRGQFRPAYLRDFELMRWSGANSFRTSHYPYDEEVIRLADRLGFLVIDEVPAVSLGFWSDRFEDLAPLLEMHKRALSELIARDANHPSVISWSIVNEANLWSEPHYRNPASVRYFREVYDHVKALDETRPVTAIIIPAHSPDDPALEACDVIGINRYFGWYTEPVDLDYAASRLGTEMDLLFERYGKPILVSEFGADAVPGAHSTTAQFFTEEFQTALIETYCRVADARPFCAGTHVWNFADFRTPQHFRRVIYNLKGVFTRTREPKRAAFFLREYWRANRRVAPQHRVADGPSGTLVPDAKDPVRWPQNGIASASAATIQDSRSDGDGETARSTGRAARGE
ncbi:MAG TPA: beta-glucuronidase [Rhodothermales bacterium]